MTEKLVIIVRWRVGVNSTITVSDGVTAAVRPTPTKKRRIANSHPPRRESTAIRLALTAQIKAADTICGLRPKASEKAPKDQAPTVVPRPPA